METEDSFEIKKDFVVNPDGSINVEDIFIPPPPVPALTYDATKERLIITELMVRDFKSYAGEHIIGPFNKNFSCIVGPNGSGKSNVIDSLLFVFGYRAQKIRSKKVSVLIHNSHKYPDLQSCSVTVNFATIKDQGSDFVILPDSKFSVSRTGYKDNSSTYEINGKRAQYKDVAALLKRYGIDLDYNRFMILQGEIELISMMKPKGVSEQDTGMLEYIEDIIGSNRFIKPIQSMNSKVEETNEIRLEKLNQLKVIEKERAEAEKPRNKAMEYIKLANKVALMENSVLQAEIMIATGEAEKLTENKNALSEEIKKLTASHDELQIGKEEKEVEMKGIVSEYEKCAKAVENLKQQFSELERKDVAGRENLKNTKDKVKKLVKSLDAEEVKIMNLKQQPGILRNEVEELEAKKKKIEEQKAVEEEKLSEIMGSMKNEIQNFVDEKDSFESELVELKNIVNEKKSEVDLAQSELDLYLSTEKKEKEKLSSLKSDYEQVITSVKEQERFLEESEKKFSETETKLLSAKQKLVEEEKREISINEELKSKRMKLEEAKNSLNASQNHNALVKAFMEQKAKGKLTGVYGRLGDLGAIDEKYDVAISTACGSLDHIVTDTITTAQQCVEFIKANNLGYTTFIALDKMKKWEPYTKEKITVPENVPRLFDLISVKDKDVLPAFYFALRNTLVAKDLEQATRVGLQSSTRYRVVTLKGELIDLSGTMSGGGGKVLKGRMGKYIADSTISEQEIQKMSADLELLMNNAAEVKKLKSELKDVINAADKEISSLKHSIKKTRQNYNGFLDRKNVLSTQIKEQEMKILEVVPDKQKVKELEACIEKKRKSYTKAADDASIIEDKVKNLQDKILAVTKGKLGTAQKRIDKLNAEINQTAQGIIKCTALLKKSEKNLSKAEEKIASLQSEIETCNKTRQDLKEELSVLEKNALEISAKQKEAVEELEQCEMKKKFISVLVQEFSTKMHQIKSELVDHKNKVKLIEIDLRAKQGQVKGLKAQLSKLELFEDDEGPAEFPTLTHEELEEVAIGKINYEIGCIQKQMEGMNPDLGAIAEFKRKEEMYRKKLKDLEETVKERDRYKGYYETLRKHRLDEFMKGFNLITLKVKELYQMITLGGDAELELVDSLDPFAEGIEFSVRPLRKSWKSIRNLSGGEKTLSSLALVFALHYYRSTPFFVMDEIDAALDFRNVSIIGSYIKDCTKNAQFIVISLRENMFLLADHLIGIYKLNNRTRNICLSPKFLQDLVQSVTPNVSLIDKDKTLTDENVKVGKQNSPKVENDNKNKMAESNELSEGIKLDKTTAGNRKCSFAVIDITENIDSLKNGNKPTVQTENSKNKSFKIENDQLF